MSDSFGNHNIGSLETKRKKHDVSQQVNNHSVLPAFLNDSTRVILS
ncbi:MAG: hypothetical protein M3M84_04915 [Thermoproteota archaeon]|nr:hypothetical protein [Thermoproteota archaeon]